MDSDNRDGGDKLKQLLVIIGKSNSGKTATMRAFAELLLKKPGVKFIHPHHRPVSLDREDADFTLVVEYHGVRIALASAGDDKWRLERMWELFAKYECQIGVVVVSLPKNEGEPKAIYDYYVTVKERIDISFIEIRKERKDKATKEEIERMIIECAREVDKKLEDLLALTTKNQN